MNDDQGDVLLLSLHLPSLFAPNSDTMLCLCEPLSAVKETIPLLRTFSHGDTCSLKARFVVAFVIAESKTFHCVRLFQWLYSIFTSEHNFRLVGQMSNSLSHCS